MPLQTLPPVAEAYARAQRHEISSAVAATGRLWRRMGPEFDPSWLSIESSLLAVLDTAQERVATGALTYVQAVMSGTGQRVPDLDYDIDPARLVGVAGNGLPTDSMAYRAVVRSRTLVGEGHSAAQALQMSGQWLSGAVGTLLSDTARTAEKMSAASRRVGGYVRMLNPPSCGRCIILAGKRFRTSQAFERHPRCDCRNIPASESVAGDLLVDPEAYLDSLDDKALARVLGSRSNAQAWQDGANTNQLINAYRRTGGVKPAQVYSSQIRYTTSATTRRSVASTRMRRDPALAAQGESRPQGDRYFRLNAPRLMPESIYQIAESREDAKRLLRLYGWIA